MTDDTIRKLIEFFDLRQFFHDNSPLRLLTIMGIMFVMWLFARFICAFIQKKLEDYANQHGAQAGADGTKGGLDKMDVQLFEKVMKNSRRILAMCILYWGLSRLVISPIYAEVVKIVFSAACIWAAIEFFTAFVPFNIDLYLRRRGATLKTSQSRSLLPIITAIIWAIGITFLLDNLGFHVSTIIAGLGIVGVAVGLAGQAILADFFSYIVILLDKPFRIGDYVVLGDGRAGDVEYMGPKTTHLRNLDDDLIVCANAEMTRGTLINQGSIHERVVIQTIGVEYSTPIRDLKRLSDILRDVVNSFPQCSFDRACLLEFGASSLTFQLLYLVSEQRGGIRDFMNTRSQVNIAILERFAEEGIAMAYNTEHVLLTNLDNPIRIALESEQPESLPGLKTNKEQKNAAN